MATEFQRIVSTIASLEGKKRQVRIGDIREVIKCLVVVEAASRIKRAIDENADVPMRDGMVFEQLDRQAALIARRELKKYWREQRKKK